MWMYPSFHNNRSNQAEASNCKLLILGRIRKFDTVLMASLHKHSHSPQPFLAASTFLTNNNKNDCSQNKVTKQNHTKSRDLRQQYNNNPTTPCYNHTSRELTKRHTSQLEWLLLLDHHYGNAWQAPNCRPHPDDLFFIAEKAYWNEKSLWCIVS